MITTPCIMLEQGRDTKVSDAPGLSGLRRKQCSRAPAPPPAPHPAGPQRPPCSTPPAAARCRPPDHPEPMASTCPISCFGTGHMMAAQPVGAPATVTNATSRWYHQLPGGLGHAYKRWFHMQARQNDVVANHLVRRQVAGKPWMQSSRWAMYYTFWW